MNVSRMLTVTWLIRITLPHTLIMSVFLYCLYCPPLTHESVCRFTTVMKSTVLIIPSYINRQLHTILISSSVWLTCKITLLLVKTILEFVVPCKCYFYLLCLPLFQHEMEVETPFFPDWLFRPTHTHDPSLVSSEAPSQTLSMCDPAKPE